MADAFTKVLSEPRPLCKQNHPSADFEAQFESSSIARHQFGIGSFIVASRKSHMGKDGSHAE